MDNPSTHSLMESKPRRVAVWIAIIATIYGTIVYCLIHSEERKYYGAHEVEKTLILRIPSELTQVDREIVLEQGELSRVQAEIRGRLGQK
jgi:hypothetical protein